MAVQDRDKFIVFNVPKSSPEVSFAKETEVGEQLPQPNIRRQGPDFGQCG
jgi:hypothetical protein